MVSFGRMLGMFFLSAALSYSTPSQGQTVSYRKGGFSEEEITTVLENTEDYTLESILELESTYLDFNEEPY